MNPLNRTTANVPQVYPPKVLQFGGGNFLRAFVDWMIEALNEQTGFSGSVVVVKPTEKGHYQALIDQEGLFHVLTRGIRKGAEVSETQLVSCVHQIIHPYREFQTFLDSAAIPSIRFIFSNTTEAGIKFSLTDRFEDAPPAEFPAKLTRWLYHRFQFFSGAPESGCYIIPCELIEDNGRKLEDTVMRCIDHWGLEDGFKKWIQHHNFFCNTLVDRIVPGYPSGEYDEISRNLGYEDRLMVAGEPYHLFVIEPRAQLAVELPFDQIELNVQFTSDVASHREIKVRILNGLHTSMVPVGYLGGVDTVREAIDDEVIGSFLEQLLAQEILPTLNFPGEQLLQYASDTLDRFRNPFIRHQLIDISLNSIAKFRTRVLPSLLQFTKQSRQLPPRIVFAFAALICLYQGKRNGSPFTVRDDASVVSFFQKHWENWTRGALTTQQLVTFVLGKEEFWGRDLRQIDKLVEEVAIQVDRILEIGIQKALKSHPKLSMHEDL